MTLAPDQRVLSILEGAWQRATPSGDSNDPVMLHARRRAAIGRTAGDIAHKAGFSGDRAALTALREMVPQWLRDHELTDLAPEIMRRVQQADNALNAKYGGAHDA